MGLKRAARKAIWKVAMTVERTVELRAALTVELTAPPKVEMTAELMV